MATSSQRLPSPAATAPHAFGAALVGRVRSAASTTPGRMRAVSLGVLGCILLAWALGFAAVGSRQKGIHSVGTDVEPVVVTSQSIQSLMSGANASAANSFLAGGVEPANQRARYLTDLQQAQDQLAQVATAGGASAKATASIRTIAESAATYSGLVESARANNRQGFPVGAGYLRRANTLVSGTVIPTAETLHQESLLRLNSGYGAASSSVATVGAAAVAVVLLVALVAAQVFLRRRTNRVLNVGLVAATGLAVVLIGWTLFSLIGEGNQVSAARDRGDALNVVAQARVTAFLAKSDESFALIARGNGAGQYRDFDAAVARLGNPATGAGLLRQASRHASTSDEQAQVTAAGQALSAYLAVHDKIHTLDTTGSSPQAITMALATGSGSSNDAFDRLDAALQQTGVLTQGQFDSRIRSAGRRLAGVAIGTSIGFLLVAALVLYGFEQRIREYR